MTEYEFQLSGRNELQVPNGRSEPSMYGRSYNQDDHRIADIEGLIKYCGGSVTLRSNERGGVFFSPVSSPHDLLGFNVQLPGGQLEIFNKGLQSKGYRVLFSRELTAEDIRKNEEKSELGRRALEHAIYVMNG